ncbi:quinone-interacting membrane-bound oxidoreductase complex, subunit QmoC [Thermodesulfovibrio sp. N1]|uniref:quinone-interacting membrane-bound oxidoreductase complex subunit QmoC n=1 Tax=unclassified Thermodesulfovibrio TaxID=2645936 RepID=UPI00083A491A|nr:MULTISPECIES: quinone-interacting membrane-bound oxidoreductase complex subunit QmoC [unclassified Thermodesulfovibrio]MDI1472674.1 quinone-interacting membrane-bound oxidoreductase complex subunit QmoC [Thermodesulfovibrio sp. 1176]ODA44440.1 quinone-interacting membrane-bound oxidoreductase complex, subunit QmoC [Thermodesulfovibrio sp. N1]
MDKPVKPDLQFAKEIIKAGGESLKKCYQCSTCTVVCQLSPDKAPFPRKEMLYAQWGMKEKLFNNPDIWLCHHCGDCTAYCPRGAKPGEVLGAVRKLMIQHYSPPKFLAKWVADPKYLLLLFLFPLLLFLGELAILGYFSGTEIPRGEGGVMAYSAFLPAVPWIDVPFMAIAAFAVICFYLGVKKYWLDLTAGVELKRKDIYNCIYETIKDILLHKKFQFCTSNKGRYSAHMLVLYAFIGLAITTGIAAFYEWVLHWPSPYPQTNIVKIIGNTSGIALLIGMFLVIVNRAKNSAQQGIGSYFDWFLITVIFGVGITGFMAQILRLAEVETLGYASYIVHLVFVFVLFAYAPHSKMAHMVYRATAMVFSKAAMREENIKKEEAA